MDTRRSVVWPLAAACAGFIVGASLWPFTGWHWPHAFDMAYFGLPRPRGVSRFDLVSNIVAYLPMGALVAAGLLEEARSPRALLRAALAGWMAAVALSYAMETLQRLRPDRVSSVIDWVLNSFGAGLGVAIWLAFELLRGLRLRAT